MDYFNKYLDELLFVKKTYKVMSLLCLFGLLYCFYLNNWKINEQMFCYIILGLACFLYLPLYIYMFKKVPIPRFGGLIIRFFLLYFKFILTFYIAPFALLFILYNYIQHKIFVKAYKENLEIFNIND